MIDIIIPVYNAHDTIVKTLASVAMQSIKSKITVYLIDDNSIIDYQTEIKFFKNRLKIKQYSLPKNSGPGYARQYGIEHSNGEFIMFLDGDDLLDNCLSLEHLYNLLEEDGDMAHGIIIEECNDEKIYKSNFQNSLHGKLYRRSFLEMNNIRFNNSRYHEDNSFNQLFLLAEPVLKELNEYVYIYRNNSNSVTRKERDYEFSHFPYFVENRLWAVKCGEEQGFKKKLIADLLFDTILNMYAQYNRCNDRSDREDILKMCIELYHKYLEYSKYLQYESKMNIYNFHVSGYIPNVTVDYFFTLIKNVEAQNG